MCYKYKCKHFYKARGSKEEPGVPNNTPNSTMNFSTRIRRDIEKILNLKPRGTKGFGSRMMRKLNSKNALAHLLKELAQMGWYAGYEEIPELLTFIETSEALRPHVAELRDQALRSRSMLGNLFIKPNVVEERPTSGYRATLPCGELVG